MIYVTSFTRSLYDFRGKGLLESLTSAGPAKGRILAYHEDSHEGVKDGFPDLPGVEYIDLFEADARLAEIVSYPEWAEAKDFVGLRRSRTFHGQFWFRKIAAIKHAVSQAKDGEMVVWLDCDNVIKPRARRSFGRVFSRVAKFDIGYRSRESLRLTTCTSLITFNLGAKLVREFVDHWYELYAGKAVFSMKYWADNWTFDWLLEEDKYVELDARPLGKKLLGCVRHRLGHKHMAKRRESTLKDQKG